MFDYFKDNYGWNLSVSLSLAMGGSLSEIDQACRNLSALGDVSAQTAEEAWFTNWTRIAQHVAQLAESDEDRGASLSAGSKWLRAANYYLFAERNMPVTDLRRLRTYRRALEAFERGAKLSGHDFERIDVPYEGGSLAGWLRLPRGEGPHPCVVFYNGLDSIKEMHYLVYADIAVARGVAVLFVDQEGTGEAIRLQRHAKRHDTEVSAGLFVDRLEVHPRIDSKRIGIVGLSAGGYCAPRAAAYEKRLKCCAVIGACYDLAANRKRYEGTSSVGSKGLTNIGEHLCWVFNVDTLEEALAALAKRNLGPALPDLTAPLLVIHGENDRQVPLWHAEKTVEEAVNSADRELRIFTILEGSCEHCGLDNMAMQGDYAFDWVAKRLSTAA